MGSICDMNNANRAAAVRGEDPQFMAGLRAFVGATITAVDVEVNEPIGTIKAFFSIRLPDGTKTTVDGPMLGEVTDDGACGFGLEQVYEQAELASLLTAAIANTENGLDDHDREQLAEELVELPNYYPDDED
jgi:hypothetical protein